MKIMAKEDFTYKCSECGEETVIGVPEDDDPATFVEDTECPNCDAICLEVSD